jgi:hypothetical protein
MRQWTWGVAACFAAGLAVLPGCGGDEDATTVAVAPDTGADGASGDTDGTGREDTTDPGDGTTVGDTTDDATADATGEGDGVEGPTDVADIAVAEGDGEATDGSETIEDVVDVVSGDSDMPDADIDQPDVPVVLTPFETCLVENGCDAVAFSAVCSTLDATKVFPNECYFFCEMGNYDDLAPVTSPSCKLPCQFDDCNPAEAALQFVCVEDPKGTFVEFANPYAACCSDGHYKWLDDPSVKPGHCPSDIACAEGCPADFNPVCGKDGAGAKLTYKNSCEISACGVSLECNAPCEEKNSCPQCASQGQCAPVCGLDDNTYRNECYAKCLGSTSAQYVGACCDCPQGAPDTLYCSLEGTTHGNLCLLTCKQDTPAYAGPCVDGCVAGANDPAEGTCGFYQGQFTKFLNKQCATLAGATCVYDGACVPGTNECAKTNQEYAPVCATVPGDDTPKTFSNLCNAGCAAAEVQTAGQCADCTVLCPADAVDNIEHCGPDCVIYPDSCVATKCAGYDIGQLSKNGCPASCTVPP